MKLLIFPNFYKTLWLLLVMYCVSIITACGRHDVENFSVKSVAIGLGHTIVLKNDGSLLAWGMNGHGQLGTGDNVARLEPVKITTSENWQDVSAGEYNTMAIQTDGTLWGWGGNNYGELGYGTFSSSSIPQKIASSTGFDKVYSISHSTYAIKKDGTLWAWGNNSEYNLGNTLIDDLGVHHTWAVNIPAKITNNNDFITLFVSDSVFLGLRRQGTYLGWGNNRFGLIFQEPLDDDLIIAPHEFDIGEAWADISFSAIHAVGIKKDGALWGWGIQPQKMQDRNYDFESPFLYKPQKISNENGWIKAVAAGLPYDAAIFYMPKDSTEKFPIFTIAIDKNRNLWITGLNYHRWIQIGTESKWVNIWAGWNQAFALKDDGTLWGIGNNMYGQLGTGYKSDKIEILVPVLIQN